MIRSGCLFVCLVLFLYSFPSVSSLEQDCTDVARDDETLLVFSTLGGGLTALDMATNEIRWTIEDEFIEKLSPDRMPLPQYLPDPRDGSLYQLGDMGGIKKMPYTIPELVANAPCRSSDGILYSGRKSDTWFLVDPKTGQKEKIFDFGSADNANRMNTNKFTARSVYLGRTQYNVLMYDSSTARSDKTHSWNVTFFDYSAHTMSPEISKDYEWLHLTGSSTGNVATLNRKTGALLWERHFSSPVVGVFILTSDGLLTVPFTPVAEATLDSIVDYARNGNANDLSLYHSLYVGEHKMGLYAIPSLTDKNTPVITSNTLKLLSGPNGDTDAHHRHPDVFQSGGADPSGNSQQNQNNGFILLGHYEMPKEDATDKLLLGPSSVSNKDLMTIIDTSASPNSYPLYNRDHHAISSDPLKGGYDVSAQLTFDQILNFRSSQAVFENNMELSKQSEKMLQSSFYAWLNQNREDKLLKLVVIILCGMVFFLFFYMRNMMNVIKQQSRNGSQTGSGGGSGSNHSGAQGTTNGEYSVLEMLDNGDTKVGKITFNGNDLLGKGCEGTFVFKGKFENRDVAVKRLLPECFTLADREVALLRESDTHENVVRYFCTENDRQFKYIALELCTATLQDYVEGNRATELQGLIDSLMLLKQAASGLAHLHTLNIVHRDIKPQNVLVSLPDVHNTVRAMISDFGLCKKLGMGRTSFSKRSGVTGTDGWIAPEMIAGRRTTTSVDIFSLGCVFYYVLSDGHHPFGEAMKRQANILSSEFNLSNLFTVQGETHKSVLAEELIQDMIDDEATKRPTARAILNHPMFWPSERILSFLQDVSDRVEKAIPTSEPLRSLERNAQLIVRNDWSTQLETEITDDLRKFRGYQGGSVRDLLRALRNKKHHYHELDEKMQKILGSIPHNFTCYWIGKFPRLLSHSYHALELCSHESSFRHYYPSTEYCFTKPEYFTQPQYVTAGNAGGDEDCNWRTGSMKPDEPNEWRRFGSTNFGQLSPQKKNKKGAYNFRRPTEGDVGAAATVVATGNTSEVVKKRKFYPRKEPK